MSKWRGIAETVLSAAKVAMTPAEIWAYAQEHGLAFPTQGKTPYASIGAQIYVDIKKNGNNSDFIKASNKPVRFALAGAVSAHMLPAALVPRDGKEHLLKKKPSLLVKKAPVSKASLAAATAPSAIATADSLQPGKALERDLHPVLAAYVSYEPHFKARVRTIYHEAS